MADDAPQAVDSDTALSGGNYEVIRKRLVEQGAALRAKAETLNTHRKETFGGSEMAVLSNTRVRTENNCVPRDIVSVGDHLLLGYNVFMGLKQETSIDDVLSLRAFEQTDDGFEMPAVGHELANGFLADPNFIKEFTDLYRYYRDAHLLQLRIDDQRLLAAFQVGAAYTDFKVCRWRVKKDSSLEYIDNRGDREYIFPPSHDFEWTPTGRSQQVHGRHPHVNIKDLLFVETVGGDLTVKVEDNTEDGQGIYSEPVDDANQTLDDGEIWYAHLGGLVLLKIKPYREEDYRYLVFNIREQSVARIDAIGTACVQLPEDHGLIFPGGFYLQDGVFKVFDGAPKGLEFARVIKAPNGEDVLYVFYSRAHGHYALLPYNLINKEVKTPIYCHGYSVFADGRMVVFKSINNEPTRVHPMQVWQTPFCSAEHAAAAPTDGSFLSKVGNAELVRGVSDSFSIARLIDNSTPSRAVYEDLIRAISRMGDAYYWLDDEAVGVLSETLAELLRTAELIVDEFEKVVALRANADSTLAEATIEQKKVVSGLRPESMRSVEDFMSALTALRSLRGQLITIREVRYIDVAQIQTLEEGAIEHFDRVSRACVDFLLGGDALEPLQKDIESLLGKIESCEKVTEIDPLRERLESLAKGLDLLTEIISGLKIDDATARTTILEGISEVFGQLNRVRATLEGRRKQLLGREGRAEFGAQFKLFGQSVSSALTMCDTPERCDDELSRLMVSLEELEARFSEFDEFLGDLASKREEVYEAFGARKQTLLDERMRRSQNIQSAANRILEGVTRRVGKLKGEDALNAYFATDGMIMKLRQLAEQLVDLGNSVKSEELLAKLKGARQDALRSLRDKLELFEGGGNLIKMGNHRFTVNTQALELTMVPREGQMMLHLTGTDFYEPVDDAEFLSTESYWSQTVVSEDEQVYRAEYLASTLLFAAEAGEGDLTISVLHEAERNEGLEVLVREAAQSRYDEGYERGLHDTDTALILSKLLSMRDSAGLLRFGPRVRAAGHLFWAEFGQLSQKALWQRKARSLAQLSESFGQQPAQLKLAAAISAHLEVFLTELGLPELAESSVLAGRYLVAEFAAERPRFATTRDASRLVEALHDHLGRVSIRAEFDQDLKALKDDLFGRLQLCHAWLDAIADAESTDGSDADLVWEATVLLGGQPIDREISTAVTQTVVKSLLGQHPRIRDRQMPLRLDEFLGRLTRFNEVRVPGYRQYRAARKRVISVARTRLRLNEFKPRVMSSFVRNKLINDVYLHMVGDNLAKQMGAAGDNKRTDLMGLLLLISPPGYGKTTLMEYVANRLGLVFVKVNGPALGHGVHSIDPAEAPNATARQEVEKINLAFEMGNNVMLYLDDIQHTHPELLQKFISLCDAQRKIEGVWKGKTRTYDMRGRKFCVVMAGNPYTETGEKFTIPDMLANRADTYNLGDILDGREAVFALSFIENALTSNAALAPLATRGQADIYKIIKMARGEQIPTTDLKHGYAAVELEEIKAVFQRLTTIQEVCLKVNLQYIESASIDDNFRTEPNFKLQGSYRNMNKMAEKVVSAMTEDEVHALIDDHYQGESQTLTTGAEHNLLKLAELRGRMSPEQEERWAEIKRSFKRIQTAGGDESDPIARVTGTLAGLGEQVEGIRLAIAKAAQREGSSGAIADLTAAVSGVREAIGQGGMGEADDSLRALTGGILGIRDALSSSGSDDLGRIAAGLANIQQTLATGRSAGLGEGLAEVGQHLAAIGDAVRSRPAASVSPALKFPARMPTPPPLNPATPQPPMGAPPPHPGDLVDTQEMPVVGTQGGRLGPMAPSGNAELAASLAAVAVALKQVSQPRLEVTVASPPAIEELLAQQIQIVERTLVPLVKTATDHLIDAQSIGEDLSELLSTLRALDARLKL